MASFDIVKEGLPAPTENRGFRVSHDINLAKALVRRDAVLTVHEL
jgi:hypothetical protein